jgi:hypothetical protein
MQNCSKIVSARTFARKVQLSAVNLVAAEDSQNGPSLSRKPAALGLYYKALDLCQSSSTSTLIQNKINYFSIQAIIWNIQALLALLQ